jgi:hypothetical protein
LFFREHQSSNLSFGRSGGGGATIVLEDLGADAPATVTRAVFGMCAGHGVRSPTSSKVQEAGPSHGLGGDVRPLRSLRGCRASPWRSWARGRCRGSGHRTLLNSNGLLLCLMRLIVVLMRLIVGLKRFIVVLLRLIVGLKRFIVVLLRLKYQSNALRSRYFNRIKQTKGITLGTLRRATPMPVRETPERVAATSSQPHAFRSAACARLRHGETAAHSSDSDGHPMANTKGHESSIR